MKYLEYLEIFSKYKEFNKLVSDRAKILDFSDTECQQALQKWIINWSNTNFEQLQRMFSSRTGPKEDVILIKNILKDADFLRTYLETFGVSFLNKYCGHEDAINLIQKYINGYSLIHYSTEYNKINQKIWKYNDIEYLALDLNVILENHIKINKIFIPLLTLIWSQTKIKEIVISAYIQKI